MVAYKQYGSREELEADGYRYSGSSRCNGTTCGAEIHWYITPHEKKLPLNPDTLEPHWTTCPNTEEFRRQ
jgi:hypothetical protein